MRRVLFAVLVIVVLLGSAFAVSLRVGAQPASSPAQHCIASAGLMRDGVTLQTQSALTCSAVTHGSYMSATRAANSAPCNINWYGMGNTILRVYKDWHCLGSYVDIQGNIGFPCSTNGSTMTYHFQFSGSWINALSSYAANPLFNCNTADFFTDTQWSSYDQHIDPSVLGNGGEYWIGNNANDSLNSVAMTA